MVDYKAKEKSGWLESPDNIRKLKIAFWIALGLLVVIDFLIDKHGYFHMEDLPGFYVIFGFISCAVLVAISKGLRMLQLTKKEGYYDD